MTYRLKYNKYPYLNFRASVGKDMKSTDNKASI